MPTERPEKPWEFDRWFVAQHGERPSREDVAKLREHVKQLKSRLTANQELLEDLEEWDIRRTSALLAWQIKDAEKR